MQEYYDAESDEVKAAVEDYRSSYNEQLKSNEDPVDWGALDNKTCSAKEPDSLEPGIGTKSQSESNTDTSDSAKTPATAPEIEKEEQSEDRVGPLLVRQR